MNKMLNTVKEIREELDKYPDDYRVLVADHNEDFHAVNDCDALVFGTIEDPQDTVVLFLSPA